VEAEKLHDLHLVTFGGGLLVLEDGKFLLGCLLGRFQFNVQALDMVM